MATKESAAGFAYPPLDSTCAEIRVLEILPAKSFADKIICQFHIVSLNDKNVHFEALSYTWGSEPQDRPIAIGSQDAVISFNPESALRRLRNTGNATAGVGRKLWVDALCINQ